MKKRISLAILSLGLIFIFVSFVTFYFVGTSYSDCASACSGVNWLSDLSPLNMFTVCIRVCRQGMIPNSISIPIGQLGILLVVIGLLVKKFAKS
ncbi:MAG: hypothetical protein J4452_00135 [Candidatus Aenigmarchaeota archaeon]|nr:hypothetical protein [Candidatus Aenigmarchaeota archaeon]